MIWTDAVQVAFMCVILIIIVLKGTLDVGGLGVVWDRNLESGRLQLPKYLSKYFFSLIGLFFLSQFKLFCKSNGSSYILDIRSWWDVMLDQFEWLQPGISAKVFGLEEYQQC